MKDEQATVYRGNCHCGRFRFELSLPGNIETAMACTCSLCVIKGYLWIIPPEGSYQVIRDDGYLREYTSKALCDKVLRTSYIPDPFFHLFCFANE